MKQKITIEIENNTGVEFEEAAEWRLVKKGEYYLFFNEGECVVEPEIIRSSLDRCFYAPVLTPKVDHELEEAKRKFPVGSYVISKDGNIAEVFDVWRGIEGIRITKKGDHDDEKNYQIISVNFVRPFPVPVWRCCQSDKPKIEKVYPIRNVAKGTMGISFFNGDWPMSKVKGDEWLDEGGE